MEKLVCPVCGEYTFKAVDSQERCPICGWINDQYQTEHIFVGHGANHFSLAQQRKGWRILNLEIEVGYGVDNLLFGADFCKLYNRNICGEECECHLQKLCRGELPKGVENLEEAKKCCAHCICSCRRNLEDLRTITIMVDNASTFYTTGNGEWGAGRDEYDFKDMQKTLKSLIKYSQGEKQKQLEIQKKEAELDLDFDQDREKLLQIFAEDKQGRYNLQTWFSVPLLSLAEFLEYALEHKRVYNKIPLLHYGQASDGEQYVFKKKTEKQKAGQVLYLSLSFLNYNCDSYAEMGLYFLDNCYEYWSVADFEDVIAEWFADMNAELDNEVLKTRFKDMLKTSFAYSTVKLILHLVKQLGYAEEDAEIAELVELFRKAGVE